VVREPSHRFLHYLCEIYQKLPDDPFFEEMDPFVKLWLYEGWMHKIENELETNRATAILTGSFSNPEMAQKMVKKDRPDFEVSDEEFDMATDVVRQSILEEENAKNNKHRRKRKLIKE
jgi:hypothetical protein